MQKRKLGNENDNDDERITEQHSVGRRIYKRETLTKQKREKKKGNQKGQKGK